MGWSESATRKFAPEELTLIRDGHVDDIVDMVSSGEKPVDPELVMDELTRHANYQKASLLLDELTRMSQEMFDRIRKHCGDRLMHFLRDTDIMRLPNSPDQARKFFGLR